MNSTSSYAVQLCDLLAGLAARNFDSRLAPDERTLLAETINGGLGEIAFNGVRPGSTFLDQIPPKRLTGPDAVDRMAKLIFGSHGAWR